MTDYSIRSSFNFADSVATEISGRIGLINNAEIPLLTKNAFGGEIPPELFSVSRNRWRGDFRKMDAIWGLKETAKSSYSRISNAACLSGDLLSFYIEPEGHGVGVLDERVVFSKSSLEITIYDIIRGDQNPLVFQDFESPKNDPSRFLVFRSPEEDEYSSPFFAENGMSGLMLMRIREITEFHYRADWKDSMIYSQELMPRYNDSFVQIAIYPWNLPLREFDFSPAQQNTPISDLSRFIIDSVTEYDTTEDIFDSRSYFPSFRSLSGGLPINLREDEKDQVVRQNTVALLSSQLPLLNASSPLSPILGLGMAEASERTGEIHTIARPRAWEETKSLSKSAMSFSLTGIPALINTVSGLNDFANDNQQLSLAARNPLRVISSNPNPDLSEISFALLGQNSSGVSSPLNIQNAEGETILNGEPNQDVEVNVKIGDSQTSESSLKNVILFFGNGMGVNHQEASSLYKTGSFGQLFWQKDFDASRSLKTTSLDGITDSAAAATAVASGTQVENGVISVESSTDDTPLKTILEYAKEKGLRTGLVTTTNLTDATMAAFAAHRTSRYAGIAYDYLNLTKPFVMLGKGDAGLTVLDATNAGYTVVEDDAELLALSGSDEMISGQFEPSGSDSYVIAGLPAGTPRLSDMVEKAIELLSYDGNGFLLVVDGALIDHACHSSLTETMVQEVLDLETAVESAYDWAENREDTMIAVFSDHETGGLDINSVTSQGEVPDVTWSAPGVHTDRDVAIYTWGAQATDLNDITPSLYTEIHHVDINKFFVDKLFSIYLSFETTIPDEEIHSVSFSFAINNFDFNVFTDDTGLLRSKTFDFKEYEISVTTEDIVYGRIGIEDENGKVSYWYSEYVVPVDYEKSSISNFRTKTRTDGSGVVDFYYNLEAPTELSYANISLLVSSDNGLTWITPAEHIYGDVGQNIPVGQNRRITWNPLNENPNYAGVSFTARLSVTNPYSESVTERSRCGTFRIDSSKAAYIAKHTEGVQQGIYDGEDLKNPFMDVKISQIKIESSSSISSESSISSISSESSSSSSSISSESSSSTSSSSSSSASSPSSGSSGV